MYFFHLFRSLLPLRNPIGFGLSDFVVFAIAGLLAGSVICWFAVRPLAARLASRTGACMLAIGLLPVVLRLILLVQSPAPIPRSSDEFSLLLLGDTLAHLRLANPVHPMHRFFETISVLQQPSYSSIYSLGQGVMLACGQIAFRSPWAGVLLGTAVLCGLCYWALRMWMAPEWALFGGLLAVAQFGPLSYWSNSYMSGAVAGSAGCLIIGSLPGVLIHRSSKYSVLLGAGLAVEFLVSTYDTLLLVVIALLFFVLAREWRQLLRTVPFVCIPLLPAALLLVLQNKAVTNGWLNSPESLSRYEYGVPASLTIFRTPVQNVQLTDDQQLDYRVQAALHGGGTDTPQQFAQRFWGRIRFGRFFLLAPMYIGLVGAITLIRTWRGLWLLLSILVLAAGENLHSYFDPQFFAAGACLLLLAAVSGLQRCPRIVAQIVILVCGLHLLFWYSVHLCGGEHIASAIASYDSWDHVPYGDPDGRIAVAHQLTAAPGKQLVFVRYERPHVFDTWIHNDADIDGSRVVWARDLGPTEDEDLRRYYPGRTAWILEPDAKQPKLSGYVRSSAGFQDVP